MLNLHWVYLQNSGQSFESVPETTLKFKFKYPGENEICSTCIFPKTLIIFLLLNNIHFLYVFGESLRNNAPPTILSSTPPSYLVQYRQRYSLQYTTHISHANKPTKSLTLASDLRQHATNVTHVSTPPKQARLYVTHIGTNSTPFLKLDFDVYVRVASSNSVRRFLLSGS